MEIIKPRNILFRTWNHQYLEVEEYPNVIIKTYGDCPDLTGVVTNQKLPAMLKWKSGIFKIKFINKKNGKFEIELYDSKKYETTTNTRKIFIDFTRPRKTRPQI